MWAIICVHKPDQFYKLSLNIMNVAQKLLLVTVFLLRLKWSGDKISQFLFFTRKVCSFAVVALRSEQDQDQELKTESHDLGVGRRPSTIQIGIYSLSIIVKVGSWMTRKVRSKIRFFCLNDDFFPPCLFLFMLSFHKNNLFLFLL